MLKKYLLSTEGAFAIKFGLISSVLMAAMAVGVDMTLLEKEKKNLQGQLDAALLAAIHEEKAKDGKLLAKSLFDNQSVQFLNYDHVNSASSRTVSATAQGPFTAFLAHRFLTPPESISVSSVVISSLQPEEVRIRGLSAHGYHRKIIRLMVQRIDDTEEELGNYQWIPTGIGPNGKMNGDLTSSANGWISLGEFKRAWLDLKVFDTGGFTSNEITETLYGPDQTFAFDDPNFANRVYINGSHLPNGANLTLLDLAPCGESERIEWEDLGEPNTPNAMVRDFTFDIDITCGGVRPNSIRISH